MVNSDFRRQIKDALTGYREGDEPLLDELGVDFRSIKKDSLRVLFIRREEDKDSDDMIGPILFMLIFGTVLILKGKVHFGYLYCLSILSCFFIYGVTVLTNNSSIRAVGIANTLGYSMIPVLLFSVISHALPGGKVAKLSIGGLFSLWSTVVSTHEILRRFKVDNRGVLIGYPIFLVYMCYILIAIA